MDPLEIEIKELIKEEIESLVSEFFADSLTKLKANLEASLEEMVTSSVKDSETDLKDKIGKDVVAIKDEYERALNAGLDNLEKNFSRSIEKLNGRLDSSKPVDYSYLTDEISRIRQEIPVIPEIPNVFDPSGIEESIEQLKDKLAELDRQVKDRRPVVSGGMTRVLVQQMIDAAIGDIDFTPYVEVAGDTMTGALVIDGSADTNQLRVQGNATQTSDLAVFEKSDGTDVLQIKTTGVTLTGNLDQTAGYLYATGTTGANQIPASAGTYFHWIPSQASLVAVKHSGTALNSVGNSVILLGEDVSDSGYASRSIFAGYDLSASASCTENILIGSSLSTTSNYVKIFGETCSSSDSCTMVGTDSTNAATGAVMVGSVNTIASTAGSSVTVGGAINNSGSAAVAAGINIIVSSAASSAVCLGNGLNVTHSGAVVIGKGSTFTKLASVASNSVTIGTGSGLSTVAHNVVCTTSGIAVGAKATMAAPSSLFEIQGSSGVVMSVDSSGNANAIGEYRIDGTKVVGNRVTGWGTPTGTGSRSALASHSAQTISATPTQAEVQNIDDSLVATSQALHQLIDDLITHGIIGA